MSIYLVVSTCRTHNYLYDLSARKATGLGYGLHIGIIYSNRDYNFTLKAITNDLWARVYWKDLPYSIVNIETKNKEYDENGYVRYNPSISGIENYRDYTQRIPTRSLVEVSKKVGKNRYDGGFIYAYNEYFPYLKFSYFDQEDRVVTVSYAHRFKTFGLAYSWQNFHIGVETDQLVNSSTLGLSIQFFCNF